MEKMKKIIVGLLMSISSCSRGLESLRRNVQIGDRHYEISQYSGGTLIIKSNK